MNERAQVVVVGPGGGRRIEGPVGGPLTFRVRGGQTNGALTAFENVIPPGQGPPLHLHDHEDESCSVLSGELHFKVGEELRHAPVGSFVFVPRGTPHDFQNSGGEPARILVMFTPSGIERFFDDFARLVSPDLKAFAELGEPLGMKVVGPPLRHVDVP